MTDSTLPSNPNTGHGWVFPRPDGMKARCGGPVMCSECAKDQARKYASEHEPHVPLSTYESAVKGRQDFRKAYVGARQLLKRFVDAWEGVPGHENMDRLCEIARGLPDDSRPAPETSERPDPKKFVQDWLWSSSKRTSIGEEWGHRHVFDVVEMLKDYATAPAQKGSEPQHGGRPMTLRECMDAEDGGST